MSTNNIEPVKEIKEPIVRRFTLPKIEFTRTESFEADTIVKWRMFKNDTMYKIYPKTMIITTIIVATLAYFKNKSIQSDKKWDDDKTKKQALRMEYDRGFVRGESSITNDKVKPAVIRTYVDMIVYLENQKNLKNSMTQMELEREKYKTMLENLNNNF